MARDPADPVVVQRALAQAYPDAACELLARDPWELLVATILSARVSDARVNQVMAVLNEHLLGPRAYAVMDPRELEPLIARVPLAPSKARSIVESARLIVARHYGQVPRDLADLMKLPGVGRKTAAVVLGNAFGQPAVAADVHVQRICLRLGWATKEDPIEAEEAIRQRVPPDDWVVTCHRMIRLGRDVCRPLKPWCSRCPVAATCPQAGVAAAR